MLTIFETTLTVILNPQCRVVYYSFFRLAQFTKSHQPLLLLFLTALCGMWVVGMHILILHKRKPRDGVPCPRSPSM